MVKVADDQELGRIPTKSQKIMHLNNEKEGTPVHTAWTFFPNKMN